MTQTIGQKLKQAREDQHLTLEKASEVTRIRAPYLQALEADDLSAMPSPVQARGFLRNYAEHLGLNIEQLLDAMRSEQRPSDQIIGPADSLDQLTVQTPEPLSGQAVALLPKPEIDSTTPTESQPEAPPEKIKGRGRKKVEPEPVVESKLETIEEPIVSIEHEPVVETPVESQLEKPPPQRPDVTENLWQTWLNRLSSIMPAGAKTPGPDSQLPEELPAADGQLPEQSPALDNLESTRIFKEIGAELRKRRELLSLHLGEVERNTHVKAHYLEALEKGSVDDLPSTVQTRGMLSNYATFLDLDVDAILLRYADALQTRHREKNPQKPARNPGEPIVANIPSIRNFIAGDMIFGVGMAVLLIGFSIWGINRVLMIKSLREVQPTAPSISDVLLASPDPSLITPSATLAPIESIVEATVTIVIPTQNLNVNVQVNLVAVERTFMRVVVDGKEVFNGRVVPGTAYPFEAEDQIEVLVGSGAAIRIVYNGRDLGLLGGLGQVINNIYLADEIITPTAQPTPTVTNTAPVTATVPPTLTTVPSATATP
jgi:cytoskeleton protein RodZ